MKCYSFQPRDSEKSQKLLDQVKESATEALKTASKKAIQKTAEASSVLIGNKIADRITKSQKLRNRIIQKQLQMSMIIKYLNKNISLEEGQKNIDDLRLI